MGRISRLKFRDSSGRIRLNRKERGYHAFGIELSVNRVDRSPDFGRDRVSMLASKPSRRFWAPSFLTRSVYIRLPISRADNFIFRSIRRFTA